jgi:hypothetical protein
MKDIQLYEQILGLVAPWRVESVTLKLKEKEIEVLSGLLPERDVAQALGSPRPAL